jgi:hypothetical protein
MMEAILVVLSNPVPGRDDEFNDWYTNIHLRDALRFRGSIAAQRFSRSDTEIHTPPSGGPARYLALYEVFDTERFAREHMDNALTPRMMVTDAIDMTEMNDFHYYLLQRRDKAPLSRECAGLVLEQMQVAEDNKEAFEAWYNDVYLSEAHKRPGVVRSAFLAYHPHGQLMNLTPAHSHVGIHHLADQDAVNAWRESTALAECGFIEQANLTVSAWDVITPRLTEDSVHHTTAAALEAEERARLRMGDKIITDRGNTLRTD